MQSKQLVYYFCHIVTTEIKVMANNTTTNEEAPKLPKRKKNGLPWWAWAAIIMLPIIALFSLPIMFGEAPEQSRYANKNKTTAKINPKNNPQQNVKPKTNVANIKQNNKTVNTSNKLNNAKPSNSNTSTALNKQQNTSNKTNNRPELQNNQIQKTPPKNGTSANALQAKANGNFNTNATNSKNKENTNLQNSAITNSTNQQRPKPQNQNQQRPKKNIVKNTSKPNIPAKTSTSKKLENKSNVNSSDIISKYKGSASKVDIAAQTNTTQIINFGTVTNDEKLLTPSAYSNFIKISKILLDNPNTKITVRTHNKDFKNAANNQKAKQQGKVRAEMLKKVLLDSGVATNRIRVELVGHTEPLIEQDPTHVRNRRVSVKIN